MSTNIPIRTVRIPALQRQCLFQRRQILDRPPFSPCTMRQFSSTPSRLRSQKQNQRQDKVMTKAAVEHQMSPAPKVNFEKAQQEAGLMAEDIGLLQDTIVRASLGKLPALWTPSFWSYVWKVVKSKGTGLYSRGAYKRCIYKKGIASYLPIDVGKNAQLKDRAQKLYEQIYHNFAKGDIAPIRHSCLPPLTRDFQNHIAARDRLKMDWKLLKWKSARVVSHRAAPLGDDHPDTAYRQVVIRLDSIQTLSLSGSDANWSPSSSTGRQTRKPAGLRWVPEEALKQKGSGKGEKSLRARSGSADDIKENRVVEYLVLQRRVVNRKEEDWKVWGFTEESTPEKMEEDAAYWRKQLNAQAAATA